MNTIPILIISKTAKPSKLTGLCNQYKFQREFLYADKAQGKCCYYTISEPGVYHCRESIQTALRKHGNYVRVSDSGEITEITEADAVAEFSLATA